MPSSFVTRIRFFINLLRAYCRGFAKVKPSTRGSATGTAGYLRKYEIQVFTGHRDPGGNWRNPALGRFAGVRAVQTMEAYRRWHIIEPQNLPGEFSLATRFSRPTIHQGRHDRIHD